MAKPPDDVEAAALFQKLHEVPAPSEVIDFPRKDANGIPIAKIRIQVLAMPQHNEARLQAHEWLKARGLAGEEMSHGHMAEVYGDTVARFLLTKACLSVNPIPGTEEAPNGKRYALLFPTPDYLDALTADELAVLFTSYMMVQRKFGPYEGNIESDEELSAWIKRLVEGASALPLAQRDWHQLVELAFKCAERAYTLSAILACPSESLASILESLPGGWHIGTSFYGARRANSTTIGLALPLSPEEQQHHERIQADDDELLNRPPPGEPVTAEQAARIAKELGFGDASI